MADINSMQNSPEFSPQPAHVLLLQKLITHFENGIPERAKELMPWANIESRTAATAAAKARQMKEWYSEDYIDFQSGQTDAENNLLLLENFNVFHNSLSQNEDYVHACHAQLTFDTEERDVLIATTAVMALYVTGLKSTNTPSDENMQMGLELSVDFALADLFIFLKIEQNLLGQSLLKNRQKPYNY